VPAQAKAVVTDEEVHHQSVAREARELPHGKEPNVEKENAEEKDNAEEKEKEKKLMETEKQNHSLSFSFSSPSSTATFPCLSSSESSVLSSSPPKAACSAAERSVVSGLGARVDLSGRTRGSGRSFLGARVVRGWARTVTRAVGI
jgi:hypothetical protein